MLCYIIKGVFFDAGVREILRTPLLKTQICTLIHETQRHRSQPCILSEPKANLIQIMSSVCLQDPLLVLYGAKMVRCRRKDIRCREKA